MSLHMILYTYRFSSSNGCEKKKHTQVIYMTLEAVAPKSPTCSFHADTRFDKSEVTRSLFKSPFSQICLIFISMKYPEYSKILMSLFSCLCSFSFKWRPLEWSLQYGDVKQNFSENTNGSSLGSITIMFLYASIIISFSIIHLGRGRQPGIS